jgi:hypothetical protein
VANIEAMNTKTHLTPFVLGEIGYYTFVVSEYNTRPFAGIIHFPSVHKYTFSWCCHEKIKRDKTVFSSLEEAQKALSKLLIKKHNCEFISQERFDKLKSLL